MSVQSFTMRPTKTRIVRHLLIVFGPTIALGLLLRLVIKIFPILQYDVVVNTTMWIPIAFMIIGAYFFILNRNHTLEIKDHTITEKNFFGKIKTKIKVKQISSFRRNILNETLLLDKAGSVLVRVEPFMENHTLFEQWLEKHNIDYH